MTSDAAGETKPAPGGDGHQPGDQPGDEARAAWACLRSIHSANTQDIAAAAAAMWVVTKASAAVWPAASALPALKPNQPNQSSPAPVMVIGRLWGMNFSRP